MKWPTWDQAAIAAVLCGVLAAVLRRTRPTRLREAILPAAHELALMSTLYSLWRLARVLPLDKASGAIARARQIDDLQQFVHLPTELSLQQFVLQYDTLARLTNWYYAVAHVPSLLITMAWLFARHRDAYPRWRNGLVIVTGFCLVIRFIRVAPPRFLPDLGYVDMASVYGMSLYGPVGTGVSDQFAAMPSIHVAWAAVVSFSIVAVSTNRWRWLFLAHIVLTMLVVSATGNHWWLDGIVAMVLLAVALLIDSRVRRFSNARMTLPAADIDPSPESVQQAAT